MIFRFIKYISCCSIVALMLVSCNSPAYIQGELDGIDAKGATLYLIKPENLGDVAASYLGQVIDSAIVNADGKFIFENLPSGNSPVLIELAVKQLGKASNYLNASDPTNSNFMPLQWQPGESLQISASVDNFEKSFSLENPSEVNKALMKLRDIRQKSYSNHLKGKEWEVENGSQLLEKEHAILMYQKQLIHFAENSQYLMPALVALRWVSPEKYYERVPEFLVDQCSTWKKKQPDHPWVKELCELSDPSKLPVLVGDVFPDLKLPSISGVTISIKEQLGDNVTIVDLWASWCIPCRKENREILVPVWDKYHKQGLEIIAYGLESNSSGWRTAVERDGADRWVQVSDLQGDDAQFLKQIRVQTIPANFILDKKGVVLAKNIHGDALKDWIRDYLENQ